MDVEQHDYVAYLLRMWRPNHGRASSTVRGWHASLEHVETGERIGFGGLDELFGFLREAVQSQGDPGIGTSQDQESTTNERG